MPSQTARIRHPPRIWIGGILIAVAMVLGILVVSYLLSHSLQGSPGSNSSCTAAPGFYCQGLTFHNSVVSFRFAQDTGTDWTSAVLYFVPYGTPYSPKTDTYSYISILNGSVFNVSIAILAGVSSGQAGTELRGYLYVNYTEGLGANAPHTVRMAAAVDTVAT